MKTTLSAFLLLLCVLTGVTASAAVIAGKVYDVGTCGTVAGQKVVVYDSTLAWRDSAVTNSAGAYSIAIPSTVPSPRTIIMKTDRCGATYYTNESYTGGNVRGDMYVCGNKQLAYGYVKLGSTPSNGPTRVWLIRKQYDPVLMDTTLTAIDSTVTDLASPLTNTGYYSFRFACTPTGMLLVKAALQPGHASYSSYLPTYYSGALNWSGATPLPAGNICGLAGMCPSTDITLTAGTNPGGSGFIGGSVIAGANKGGAVGDPLPGRIILLLNGNGQAVAYAYSDAAGKFQFPALAQGSYKLSGDAWGKTNPPLTVTISQAAPSIANIVFEEKSKTFVGRVSATGVSNTALAGVGIYPNPAASGHLYFKGLSAISGEKLATVRSVTGAVLVAERIGTDSRIAVGSLPAGAYFVQLQTEGGVAVFSFVR